MVQQREKIKKIVKFEQVMKRFCKDIGVDKKTLLSVLLGGEPNSLRTDSGRKELKSRDSSTVNASAVKTIVPINTGVAAQFAYNNIIPTEPE